MIKYRTFFVIIALISVGFFIYSCSENPSNVVNNEDSSDKSAKALVIVVENSDIVGFSDENLYNTYKYSITPVLSSIFSVPTSNLNSLNLGEMLEKYGEPWEIEQIFNASKGFYNKIIILNNQNATFISLLDSLNSLKDKFTIDLILNIHGSPTSIVLTDGEILIGKLTNSIAEKKIKIRAVYQTCCYGKFLADYWRGIGVKAVNGAVGYNVISLFSVSYFLTEWLSGKKTFEEAVFNAYNLEIEKLRTYNKLFPIETYILTPSNLSTSLQTISGSNKDLLWQ